MMDMNASGALEPIKWGPDLTQKTVSLFLLVGLTNWLAEYSSNQNVIQRYAASKNMKQAKIAIWVCCIFSVPTWALFMFLGTALFVFFHQFPTPEAAAMLNGTAKAEQILPYFVIDYLPPGLSGLVIAGVLAAAMSSLSSSINGVSAVSLVDIYKRHMAPGRTDRHYVIVAKLVGLTLSAIMIGGAAMLMALQSTTLQDTASILGALTAGGLLGIYLLGFFTKVGDDRAIITGIFFTLLFTAWMALSGMKWLPPSLLAPIHGYYAGLLGHIIMFVIGYTVGAIFPKAQRDLTNLTVWTQDGTPIE
jgi:SSS family solute:Na+ symporter